MAAIANQADSILQGTATRVANAPLPHTINVATNQLTGTIDLASQVSGLLPNTSISGLGTLSTQNANAIAVTGGSLTAVAVNSATLASPTISIPALTGGTVKALTTLGVRSTVAAFDLDIANTEALTADRKLTYKLNDVDRVVNLSGDVITSGKLTYAGAFDSTFTLTGTTTLTFPLTGTLTTLSGTEALTNKTVNKVTITAPATTATLTLANNSSLVTSGAFVTTFTITGTTGVTFPNSGTLATLAGSEALTNKTYNGNTWTAGTGTLTLSAGKVLTSTNTLTFSGTDGSTLNIGTGGTLGTAAYTSSSAYLGASATAADSSALQAATWASPGAIGSTTRNTGAFTSLTASVGFGCNGAAAQTAVASGGALAAYAAGINGFSTAGMASALYAQVVAIRAALVANGIMS